MKRDVWVVSKIEERNDGKGGSVDSVWDTEHAANERADKLGMHTVTKMQMNFAPPKYFVFRSRAV